MKLHAFDALIHWKAKRRKFRRTMAELQSMDRDELDDLNLSLAQLTGIARRAAYGTKNS